MKKRVVQASEFEVVDERGAVRLRIGLSNDEDPFFSLLSPDGRVGCASACRATARPAWRSVTRTARCAPRWGCPATGPRAWRSGTRTGGSGRSSDWRPRLADHGHAGQGR